MGCDEPNVRTSTVLAWTSGSSGTDLFVPATGPLRTADWNSGLVTLEVEATSDSAAMEVVRSYSLSNDGITWDTPVTLADATPVASGRSYGATLTSIPVSKAWVRFGVTTNQLTGSDLEQMRLLYTLTLVKR